MEKRWLFEDRIRHRCVRCLEAAGLPAGQRICDRLIGVCATPCSLFFAVGVVLRGTMCIFGWIVENIGNVSALSMPMRYQQQVANTLFV